MLGELMALGAALSWSVSVLLFKQSESAGPLGMNLFKNLLSIGLLVATLPALGVHVDTARAPGEWVALAASGILGIAVADTLVFAALARLGPAMFAVVDLVYAPVVVTASMVFLGERPGAGFAAGAALVVAGVGIAVWPANRTAAAPAAGSEGGRPARGPRKVSLEGVAIGIAGLVALAAGILLAKPGLERGALPEVMLVRLVAGTLGQLVWIALLPSQRSALAVLRPSRTWRTLAPAAFLGSYLAMLLWLGGFKWAPASTAAVLNQTSAVWTILLARVFLGDALPLRQGAGAAVALAGAFAVLLG